MATQNKDDYKPQALKVYWNEEIYGPTKTAIVCDRHKVEIYRAHPNACGVGELFPVEQCEKCRRTA